jgi:putative oxidoreductase
MKKYLNILDLPVYANVWLLVIRIGFPAALMTHGYPKLTRLLDGNFQFGDPIGIGAPASLVLVTFAEFFCSLLVMLGLGTRFASIPVIIAMLVASLIQHANDGFAKQELSLLFVFGFGTFLVFGAGKYSVDYILTRKK